MSDETTVVVTIDGADYDLDMSKLRISESIQLKKYTGWDSFEWQKQLGKDEPEAWQFLVWLAKTRAGEDPGRISEIDADILAMNPRPKVMLEDVEEPEPGPTGSPESDTP